eukprot:g24170.t1
MQIVSASTLCSAFIIEFTTPQVVRLSQNTTVPLRQMSFFPHRTVLQLRCLGPQTAITAVQFALVRALRDNLDKDFGDNPFHLSAAYGAASVPLIALKYNMITADIYKYQNLQAPTTDSRGYAGMVYSIWTKKIKPGLLWSYLRDTGSIGGALILSPHVTAHLISLLPHTTTPAPSNGNDTGQKGSKEGQKGSDMGAKENRRPTPSAGAKFIGGLVTGCATGLATQLFHNAALKAGQLAELGQCPGNIEAMHSLLSTMGIRAVFMNFPFRVGIIAGWSAILNVTDPFRAYHH